MRLVLGLLLAAQAATGGGAGSKEVLLEQAIYTEETAGDIEAAIRLYRQIVAGADADRAVTAQALYRLGLCLERRGRKDEARDAFARLVQEFSDQADLAARVRARLAPRLMPAPWTDGEALWVNSRSADSDRFAMHELQFAVRGAAGTWMLSRYHVSAYRSLDVSATLSRVEADADTFMPVQATYRGRTAASSYDVRYGGGRAEVTSKGTTAAVPLKAAAFDRAQLVALLRRLPLADGFTTAVPVFSSSTGVVDARITVAGRESVTVPAGTFDCYKVTVSMGPVHATEDLYWISADAHRYPVREGTAFLRELARVGRWDPAARTTLEEERWGIALTPPAGWISTRSAYREGEPSFSLTFGLASPDAAVACSADFQGEGGYMWRREWPPREAAQWGLRLKTTARSTLAVRDASWSDAPVAGLPAARYVADYRDAQAERDMTEYAVYVRAQATLVEFACRVAKAEFEARKAEMETLLESIRIP